VGLAGLKILVVNAGSTSLKLSLVDGDHSQPVEDFVAADAVAHRIVHLGDLQVDAALIDESLLRHIEEGAEIAPLHNGPALRALEDARQALPDVPHVAVSDSWFHRTMPAAAREYPIPRDLRESHDIVRRGFHGLSVEWAAAQVNAPRLVVCHLGGGCSVTAVSNGRSIDTTMGWTPLEGLPGATRSGSIDPGALLYLIRHGISVDELDRVLEHDSGLAALGGLDQQLGFEVFTYRVGKAVGAMAAALGGLDALAFTAGIGENRADVRRAVAEQVRHLGADVHVVRAREDVVAARHARAALIETSTA
jgi:acetate kinase